MPDTQQLELDFDNMSLDELRALANQETPAEDKEVTPTAGQPRDEQGRFTAQVASGEEPKAEDEPETVVYRREIDLGDGAGKEVFEAESMEALLDKIVEAKAHATKKIREQQAKLREIEHAKEQTTDDEEFVISQELMSRPTDAIKKLFKKATGLDISEFKTVAERARALEAAQTAGEDARKQDEASAAFMQSHPEYVANAANGKRLVREINSLIGEAKAAGKSVDYADVLEQAYTGLSADGLLQLKTGDEAPPAKATPTVTPRRSSGLSSRSQTAVSPRATEPSEDDLYSMSMDQLKELANRQLRGA